MVGEYTHFCIFLSVKQVLKLLNNKSFVSAENRILPTEVRKDALQLQKLLEYDDTGAEGLCFLSSFKITLDLHSSLYHLRSILLRFVSYSHRRQLTHGR